MTVKDLIEQLQKEDPDRLVVMSKDSEGNNYSPLYQFTTDAYLATSTYSGEIGLEELTDDLKGQGYNEEDVFEPEEGAIPCITFWPVN